MRVLIFGRTGQVAHELLRASWPREFQVTALGRPNCDLSEAQAVGRAVGEAHPDIVVNAAAYTAVDRAETEPELAERINCEAPAAMAVACQQTGAALIHLSTDYVFDGSKSDSYRENDPIAPLSVYGRTKAAGESAVRAALARHVILRTSWVFAAHGNNFVRTMLRLGSERPELKIVCDQRGSPTAARDIARAIASIARSIAADGKSWGTFHFAGDEPTTWLGFAEAIFALAARSVALVPIVSAEYKTAAQRPLNSVLDCGRIRQEYGIDRPSWRRALADVLAELREPGALSGTT